MHPGAQVQMLWINNCIGRMYDQEKDIERVEQNQTLADHNITYWLKKFPHW